MQADDRGQFVEAAAGRHGVVHMQLPIATVEVGAPQSRCGPFALIDQGPHESCGDQNISDAPGFGAAAAAGFLRAGMKSPVIMLS